MKNKNPFNKKGTVRDSGSYETSLSDSVTVPPFRIKRLMRLIAIGAKLGGLIQ